MLRPAGDAVDEYALVAASPLLMRRAFAVLFLVAPVFGLLWLALPDSGTSPSPLLSSVLVFAALVGLTLLAVGRRLPERHYSPVLLIANASVTVAFVLTGDPTTGTAMLYLWATPYAFWFFSLRRALLHVGVAALSCATALLALAPDVSPATLLGTAYLGTWLHTVVTMAVIGLLVRSLARWLRRYGERLAQRAAAQAALVDLGRRALAGGDLLDLFRAAVTTVGDTGEATGAALYRLDPGAGRLRLIAHAGEVPAVAGLEDLTSDAGWMSVRMHRGGEAFGVLAVRSMVPIGLAGDAQSLLEATANVVSTALDRDVVERRIRHAALHDPLTGLPNRALFLDLVDRALAAAAGSGACVAVMLLDLDGFKTVNDSLGHAAGDQLLTAIAPRLQAAVRSGDTVARLGGDEFVLLCGGVAGEGDALEIAERVCQVWTQPVLLDGSPVHVSGSIGIALSRGAGATASDLVRDADAAMYRAKSLGRGRYEVYGEDLRADAFRRLEYEGRLRGALERNELAVAYQPIVDLDTGAIVGAEALVRWHHPELGVVPPSAFVPLAEETGAIVPIGRHVLREASAQLARWRSVFPAAELRVTVNASPRQLLEPGFVEDVASALRVHDLPPGSLGIELTENVLMEGSPDQVDTLTELRKAGAFLLLDDFGTGYSSLGYLKRFPVDVLKLDRSFVTDLGSGSEQDLALVRAVVDVATALGLYVVAEGVERDAQAKVLRRLGCGHGQGFLWSSPVTSEELLSLLARQRQPALPAA